MHKFKKLLASVTVGKKNKKTHRWSRSPKEINSSESAAAPSNEPTDIEPSRVRFVQNFYVVWLDGNIDKLTNNDCHNTLTKLRQVVSTVNTFNTVDECINFISGNKEEKIFIISSGSFGHTMVPVVHDMAQVRAIYIFCGNKAHHEEWATRWPKVKDVFTDITPICEALNQASQECDQNSVSMSFVAPNTEDTTKNLDHLDQSFIYMQILKEILFTIDFQKEHLNEFITYCREQFAGNIAELQNVDKLEWEYSANAPVWWYTYHCFLYSMLNRALRTMEVDLIIKMGFFICDLHEHIIELHSEQYAGHGQSASFTVFRGQGLSPTDFDQLKKAQDGLMSFNNFLSTRTKRPASLQFARNIIAGFDDLVGILFVITVDSSISSTPYANIHDVSYYEGKEEEILFSMHSIFHIGHNKQIDNNPRLWQVDLTLISDSDPQLYAFTQRIRDEIFPHQNGWYRLANLLTKLGHLDKAQQVFDNILDQTTDEWEAENTNYQLGVFKLNQREYMDALIHYEKSLKIRQRILSSTHPNVTPCFNGISLVHNYMGRYSKALLYYEKALKIRQKTLPPNHPDLAESYNNIGLAYDNMGEYSEALLSHKKALEIYQKTLPPNHPLLATSYVYHGSVYDEMGEYSTALLYYKKARIIYQKTLPANHSSLVTSSNTIGLVHVNMGEYSKALSYLEGALEIRQKNPENHPDLALTYVNIGMVSSMLGEHSKAILYCERALKVVEHSLTSNHPLIKLCKDDLEFVKKEL